MVIEKNLKFLLTNNCYMHKQDFLENEPNKILWDFQTQRNN